VLEEVVLLDKDLLVVMVRAQEHMLEEVEVGLVLLDKVRVVVQTMAALEQLHPLLGHL
jgi:hypothetical protein